MRSKILKAVILFAVFCAGVFLFSGLMNTQVTESASNLEDSTLPVMCVNIAGNRVNRMYGYKVAMEPKQMRDSLIPMTTDREITVSYKAFGNRVKSVSFEVTTPDTGEVIENAKIGGFTTDGDYKTATFSLSKPILDPSAVRQVRSFCPIRTRRESRRNSSQRLKRSRQQRAGALSSVISRQISRTVSYCPTAE